MRKYMSKRQRPCDFCRSRKTACSIKDAPPCRSCVLYDRPCTFVEAAPRRKRASPNEVLAASPEAQRQNLDSASGAASGSADGGGSPARGYDLSLQFLQDLDFDEQFQSMMGILHSPEAASSHDSTQGTATDACLDAIVDRQDNSNPAVLGFTGDMDPYLLRSYRADERGVFQFKQLAIQSVQAEPVPIQFLLSRQTLFAKSREEMATEKFTEDELKQRLEQAVPSQAGTRLISLYRRFIAPYCPVFSSQIPLDPLSTPTHLLAAIYAVAFPFAMYDDKLSIELAYDAPPYNKLFHIINTSISVQVHAPSLATAQTLLLLVMRPSTNPLVSDAPYRWSLMGNLISVSDTLGLHLDPSGWGIVGWQIMQRKRLSFLVYAADKWLAATLGRPPRIHDDNWMITSVSPDIQTDSGLSDREWEDLVTFSSLTQVLSSTLADYYSLRAIYNGSKSDSSSKLLYTLDDIYRSSHDATNSVRQVESHYIRLLILRATMREHLTNSTSATSSIQDQRHKIRACLEDTAKYIQGLGSGDTTGFWPPWCQAMFTAFCFTLLTMTVSARDIDEASEWIRILWVIRKELRLKANSLPVIRLSLLRIDSIFWRGVDNVLDLEPHVLDAFKLAQAT